MRLVNVFDLTERERQHAWSSEKALERVRQALQERQPVEGLNQLRAGLMIDIDSEVLDAIERGEWRLIRPEADFTEWVMPDRAFDPKVMALMQNPPAQPSRTPRIFRIVDSATGEPLVQRHYLVTLDGATARRRTDGEGIAHLFVSSTVPQISMTISDG